MSGSALQVTLHCCAQLAYKYSAYGCPTPPASLATTTMSNTLFKITNPLDGSARRLAFASTPSWAELSGKLESLYSIPKEDVCVSYTDADGDTIVLSSDSELKEYYEAFAPEQTDDSVRAIRFAVRNLRSIREANASVDPAPADHEHVPGSPAADVNDDVAPAMEVDETSETSVSSLDSDVEVIPRGESPSLLDVETIFVLPFTRGRGRHGHFGRGGGRGRFHAHHDPRNDLPLPPFPPFMAPGGVPMPPADGPMPPPPPFAMFGRGRGGHHAHMHGRGGMRGHPYHPHGHHAHVRGPSPHRRHHHDPRHPAMGMHVPPFLPPFPPMRGGFGMAQGV